MIYPTDSSNKKIKDKLGKLGTRRLQVYISRWNYTLSN